MQRIVFVAVPPLQILDLTGPFEVFARCGSYRVELLTSSRARAVASSSGLSISGARYYGDFRGEVDTLVVPGGAGAEGSELDEAFLEWLARTARKSRRVCSICTGSFVLAAAGLLDGRRATTHWGWCDRLARRFPAIRVEADPIFIKHGNVYTSAGVTAGIDLALALVEEDQGRQKAREIARDLVMYLRRSGGQSQFSAFLANPASASGPIESVQLWIAEHLSQDLTVDALADRCAMSPRHFARVFRDETGVTPGRFVEQTRIRAARQLLEDSRLGIKRIAERCGFNSIDSLRRSFVRTVAMSPSRYRQNHAIGSI